MEKLSSIQKKIEKVSSEHLLIQLQSVRIYYLYHSHVQKTFNAVLYYIYDILLYSSVNISSNPQYKRI
jgi:hypothetical protein